MVNPIIASNCRFKDFICNNCGRKGHLVVKCRDREKEGNEKSDSKNIAKQKGKFSNRGKQNFLEDDLTEIE